MREKVENNYKEKERYTLCHCLLVATATLEKGPKKRFKRLNKQITENQTELELIQKHLNRNGN